MEESAHRAARRGRGGPVRFASQLRHLLGVDSGAFVFVMATAVVSTAAWLQHLRLLSDALLVVACLGWVTLTLIISLRGSGPAPAHPQLEAFALVAATAVVGARFSFAGQALVALALWALAVAAWLVLLARSTWGGDANGGWFLIVVGTESLAVLAAVLAPRWGAGLLEAALGWWLLGLGLYPLVAGAVAVGLRRRPRFAPALWITMGALAIATLAGTELLLAARALHTFGPFRSWLRDADLATWALASATILPLTAAELRNRARWWDPRGRLSFVFPLGMYGVASQQLARAAPLAPLAELGQLFFVIALLAWGVVLLGRVATFQTNGRPTPERTT